MQRRRLLLAAGAGLAYTIAACGQPISTAPARTQPPGTVPTVARVHSTLPEQPIVSEDILTIAPPSADQRIAYGSDPNQFGDLWLPSGAGPHPVAIVVHGGYWRSRYDLTYFGHCCADLAAHGIAAWNIEYRRVGNPGGAWPGTFQDVGAAADKLREIAQQYQLDLERISAIGHSAGGHLALWLAARHKLPADSPIAVANPLALKAVIALAPVADLRMAWELGLSNTAAGELLGASPAEHPARYDQGSPAELLPLGVPQFVVHGRADSAVPFAVSEQYVEKARAAGDPAELIELTNTGHFEIVDPRTTQWREIRKRVEHVSM
jgi:acetyl esterase/lipase